MDAVGVLVVSLKLLVGQVLGVRKRASLVVHHIPQEVCLKFHGLCEGILLCR